MALIDTYRNNVIRKKQELAKLSEDRTRENSKAINYKNKIISAQTSISRTKSESMIKSKSSEIDRTQKDLFNVEKKIAEIDKKMAQKEKDLLNESKKLQVEEQKELKKRNDTENKRIKESQQQLNTLNNSIKRQTFVQSQLLNEIEQLKRVPQKITVLFMASNPNGTGQLKLDEEARSIQDMIRKSEHRDSVRFETRWAVRPMDILQAINELEPTIVHFSGHGAENGDLLLQNQDGTPKLVSKEAITQTIMTASENVKVMFFNACYSYEQAENIVKYIDVAIGMTTAIGDEAACIFASQFYSSIGFGLTVKKAFDQAKAALMLEGIPEENTPILYFSDTTNINEMILVSLEKEGD